ncbi:hypothetical protein D3C74_308510 [compost metagenome]
MNVEMPNAPDTAQAMSVATTSPARMKRPIRTSFGYSSRVSGLGTESPAPPRYLRPATKNTSAIAMPTAATAKPAWYPHCRLTNPTMIGERSEPRLMPM